MRKFFNIFLFVLCTIAIAGCNDTESSESKLEIKAVNTNFQAPGGRGYIQLQSTGNITADVDADWCVLKEVNPNEVVFEVKENTGYSGRNALLTISNGVEKKAFNINQSGAVFIFGKDEWMLRTDNKAATLPIKLQSSFDYTIDIPAEAQEWLSFEQNAKGINFKVKENTSGKMRGAIVNVAAKDRSASYQVIQYDVDELTGTWQGMFSDGQMNYGLKDVIIEKQEDGTYLLSNILTGLPYKLKAKAIDNCLAFGPVKT